MARNGRLLKRLLPPPSSNQGIIALVKIDGAADAQMGTVRPW